MDSIDIVAEALFHHLFGNSNGKWNKYKVEHPDIADIFRGNACVAIEAIEKIGLDRISAPAMAVTQ